MTDNVQQKKPDDKRALIMVMAGAAVLLLLGSAGVNKMVGTPTPTSTYQTRPEKVRTVPEKVQAAVAAQYSCTPSLDWVKFIGSDRTGTGYMVGCGRWLYWVLINPQEQIEVSRLTEWNGR